MPSGWPLINALHPQVSAPRWGEGSSQYRLHEDVRLGMALQCTTGFTREHVKSCLEHKSAILKVERAWREWPTEGRGGVYFPCSLIMFAETRDSSQSKVAT